jgi:hypothetical protein
MLTILDHFDTLTKNGLKIIPLRENSKIPMCKGWSKDWDRAKARNRLEVFPDANIGLLLGEVVDVEGDSDEANRLICDLIGNYPHPMYQSIKSIHHLFLNPDPDLSHFRWNDIEFRGYGHQSVLPPSHYAGVQYRWINTFRFPIPSMPPKLLNFYQIKRYRKIQEIKPGHIKVWCYTCRRQCYLHEKRFKLELKAFKFLGQKWECHKCRIIDLRPTCRMIRSGVSKKVVLVNALQQV